MISSLLFYLFAGVLLASATMVVAARNPVHAVLFLILCFFNAAGLFLLMGAEFLAFILMIVYVGAVAVLFLFVVMMLDINLRRMRQEFKRHLPLGGAVALILAAQLVLLAMAWKTDPKALSVPMATNGLDNTRALGGLLYTQYFYPFQVSGFILLVAMVGAITLTLRTRKGVLRQNVTRQLDRSVAEVLEIHKVPIGQGISDDPKP